jgi:D-alanyl-D-alanine endopeptidase (penicillin-binding protein 7)
MDMKHFLLALIIAVSPAWGRVKTSNLPTESVLIFNVSKNRPEYERNVTEQRSIASITKIMTAMVTLDHDKDLGKKIMHRPTVATSLPRQQYTRQDLLTAMLVKSDNGAAETLARDYPGGVSAFVQRMNLQAREWGMSQTEFVDPHGLGAGNISTVMDVANMITTSTGYWFIRETSVKKQVAIETQQKKRVRTISLAHTSAPMLFEFDNIIVSKTGLTSAAGWCVGMAVNRHQDQYVIVVLGSPNKAHRFAVVKDMMYNHVLDQNIPYSLDLQ